MPGRLPLGPVEVGIRVPTFYVVYFRGTLPTKIGGREGHYCGDLGKVPSTKGPEQ